MRDELNKMLIGRYAPVLLLVGTLSPLAVHVSLKAYIYTGFVGFAALLTQQPLLAAFGKRIPEQIKALLSLLITTGSLTIAISLQHTIFTDTVVNAGSLVPLLASAAFISVFSEMYAVKNGIMVSIVDSVCLGLAFAATIVVFGSLKELVLLGSFNGVVFLPGIGSMGTSTHAVIVFLFASIVAAGAGFISRRKKKVSHE